MADVSRRARLPRSAAAPSQARRTMDQWLREALDVDQLDDVKLLVSELVTNAVRHPHDTGRIELEVAIATKRVRVVGSDPGTGFTKPKVGAPPADALGGRGLLIVDRIASRWGVTPGRRTRVWFEVDR
jgi:anti-sigma regulatory factor (Ser/Thr protein kinase)